MEEAAHAPTEIENSEQHVRSDGRFRHGSCVNRFINACIITFYDFSKGSRCRTAAEYNANRGITCSPARHFRSVHVDARRCSHASPFDIHVHLAVDGWRFQLTVSQVSIF